MKSGQRKAATQPGSAAIRPAEPAAAERSEARPLPPGVRARMEATFGADFSDVTVRQDDEAAATGAIALTRGSQITVDPGAYDSSTTEGLEVLGHELAHVLQQRTGRVPGTGLTEEPNLESEAEEAGRQAAKGQPVTDAAADVASSLQGSGQAGSQAVAQPMRRSDAPFTFPPMQARVMAEPGPLYVPSARHGPAPIAPPVVHEATHSRQPEPQGTDVGSPHAYEEPEEAFVPRNRRPTF